VPQLPRFEYNQAILAIFEEGYNEEGSSKEQKLGRDSLEVGVG
jgi:hypothetical protein